MESSFTFWHKSWKATDINYSMPDNEPEKSVLDSHDKKKTKMWIVALQMPTLMRKSQLMQNDIGKMEGHSSEKAGELVSL